MDTQTEVWTVIGDDPANLHVVEAARPHMRVCFLTSNGPTERRARLIAVAPNLLDLIKYMLGAIDGGNIDSEQIDGDHEVGIPPHKWHEEWAHHARAAIGRISRQGASVTAPDSFRAAAIPAMRAAMDAIDAEIDRQDRAGYEFDEVRELANAADGLREVLRSVGEDV